jgi:hypothetical protein
MWNKVLVTEVARRMASHLRTRLAGRVPPVLVTDATI